jgi:hypothetical protein
LPGAGARDLADIDREHLPAGTLDALHDFGLCGRERNSRSK